MPTWMKIPLNNSLDVERYKKVAIDLSKEQGGSEARKSFDKGVFSLRKQL